MADLSELVSVLVCTSPTASDPSPAAILQTLASVAAYDDIGNAPLIIGADGVRPEQRHLADAYDEKVAVFALGTKFVTDCRVLRLPAWGHQANVMRMLLEHVTTPLVLFLEHDAPLTPDVKIDWEGCAETILSGELHSIRFLHESRILPDYQHLMLEATPDPDRRVPYIRTAQWSQRPHLADADWYRWLINTYFAHSSRCFVEDAAYGIVNYFWREQGAEGLHRFRLGIYADPEPTMQRSYHLDGRGGEPKGGQVFSYPGDTQPEGAPRATLARVFES